jgi:hypothetical protein
VWNVTRTLSTAVTFVILGRGQFMLGIPAVTFVEIFCLLLLGAATVGADRGGNRGATHGRAPDNAERQSALKSSLFRS